MNQSQKNMENPIVMEQIRAQLHSDHSYTEQAELFFQGLEQHEGITLTTEQREQLLNELRQLHDNPESTDVMPFLKLVNQLTDHVPESKRLTVIPKLVGNRLSHAVQAGGRHA